jgi:hypothetical protein
MGGLRGLTGIDGVSFREAWASRVEVSFAAAPLYVIGLEMLLRNKRAAGREKDLRDVALLEQHRPVAKPKPTAKKKRPLVTK